MSQRGSSGFTYKERLSVGVYGEVFRARTAEGDEVRVLHVDPRLAEQPGFAAGLARYGAPLVGLSHPGVVTTRTVGRVPDGHLVVVTDPVRGPVTLQELCADARDRLPPEIALAIASDVVAALAAAHEAGVVHGGVHPRSVLVDFGGRVKLGDFAAARALMAAAASDLEADLLGGFAGFLAPELALGDEPSTASDVYAAGALAFTMLTGEPPPGSLASTAALERVIFRALDTDLGRRYPDAVRLADELSEAMEDDNWQRASAETLATFVGESRAHAEADLDAATEDLLADLVGGGTGGDGDFDDSPTALAGRTTAVVDFDPDPPTEVDESLAGRVRDPISEIIALDPRDAAAAAALDDDPAADEAGTDSGDHTPLPPPRAEDPGTITGSGDELLARAPRREQAAAAAAAAIASLEEEEDDDGQHDEDDHDDGAPEEARFVFRRPTSDTAMVTASPPPPRRSGNGLWMASTAVAALALGVVLYTQTDVFHPERARQRAAERQAEKEEELRRFEAAQPRSGTIALDSSPGDAAVWLLLGRTPLESPAYDSGVVHELRLEHEGYRPLDVRVVASHWSGQGTDRVARVSAALVPGAERAPAAPPEPPPEALEGLAPGSGPLMIESEPPGAQVWVLVGFTPNVRVTGVRAGGDYELKVVKDGYRPGFAVIRAADWPEGGPEHVSRRVTLASLSENP